MTDQQRVKLLIAEDNDLDVFLIRRALDAAKLDYEAEIAIDGESMLERLNALEQSGASIGGIILDLNLVTHSGLEILNRIRAISTLAGTPVVILTSSNSRIDRQHAETLGVSAYLLKPMDLKAFMQIGQQIADIFAGPFASRKKSDLAASE